MKAPSEAASPDSAASLRIVVNGEAREARPGETLAALLERLGVAGRRIAVERNRAIVPRSAYASATLAEGDVLEIVHFVGGG